MCRDMQPGGGRGPSYPRNVGSAAPASLATPAANFSASITSTLNFKIISQAIATTSAHILSMIQFFWPALNDTTILNRL